MATFTQQVPIMIDDPVTGQSTLSGSFRTITIDDFQNLGGSTNDGEISFQCAICGGVYPRSKGIIAKNGRRYCTVHECSGDAPV